MKQKYEEGWFDARRRSRDNAAFDAADAETSDWDRRRMAGEFDEAAPQPESAESRAFRAHGLAILRKREAAAGTQPVETEQAAKEKKWWQL